MTLMAQSLTGGMLIIGERDIQKVERVGDYGYDTVTVYTHDNRTKSSSMFAMDRHERLEVTEPLGRALGEGDNYKGSIVIEPAYPPSFDTEGRWGFRHRIVSAEGEVLEDSLGIRTAGQKLDTIEAMGVLVNDLVAANESILAEARGGWTPDKDPFSPSVMQWVEEASMELDAFALEMDMARGLI